jgi:Putative MetA-pathway of phenol degradation
MPPFPQSVARRLAAALAIPCVIGAAPAQLAAQAPAGRGATRSDSAPAAARRVAADAIEADRPDFTEASTTVGKGRAQLEAGYTFSRDRGDGSSIVHTYPEALLRVGVFADWFEARVAQTFVASRVTGGIGGVTTVRGAEDLYVGAKLALRSQRGLLPETALVLQATVPTGTRSLGAHTVLPGVNLLYGWDVLPERISIGGSTQGNASENESGARYMEVAQALTVGVDLTSRFGAYGELYSLVPTGRNRVGVPTMHYINGGLRFRVTPDLQYDIRIGSGLNRAADDLFVGVGFSVRR